MGASTETRRALVLLVSLARIYWSCAFVCPLVRSSASIAAPPSLGVAVASPTTSRSRSLQQQQHLPRQQCAPQSAPEDGTKEGGAGAGMGLDGDWQVVSGEVRLPACFKCSAVRFGCCGRLRLQQQHQRHVVSYDCTWYNTAVIMSSVTCFHTGEVDNLGYLICNPMLLLYQAGKRSAPRVRWAGEQTRAT